MELCPFPSKNHSAVPYTISCHGRRPSQSDSCLTLSLIHHSVFDENLPFVKNPFVITVFCAFAYVCPARVFLNSFVYLCIY